MESSRKRFKQDGDPFTFLLSDFLRIPTYLFFRGAGSHYHWIQSKLYPSSGVKSIWGNDSSFEQQGSKSEWVFLCDCLDLKCVRALAETLIRISLVFLASSWHGWREVVVAAAWSSWTLAFWSLSALSPSNSVRKLDGSRWIPFCLYQAVLPMPTFIGGLRRAHSWLAFGIGAWCESLIYASTPPPLLFF